MNKHEALKHIAKNLTHEQLLEMAVKGLATQMRTGQDAFEQLHELKRKLSTVKPVELDYSEALLRIFPDIDLRD